MRFFKIVAIGASAGGVTALISLLADMPKDFPVPIVIVQHLDPTYKSLMSEILQRKCKLKLKEAENGDDIKPGIVYIAPKNRHMLVINKKIALTITPRVHFSRPSVDTLFHSVAAGYGDGAIGIILSGTGNDGSAGLKDIKDRGGTTFAQDEETSESFGMPGAAIRIGAVDFILPIQAIGLAIIKLMTKQTN